ncbi:hypothetical protein [Streptomyces lunaelactis]|nr:hypothetical protein [Streptomyces lunaelactis]
MTSEITVFVNPAAGRGRGAHAAQPAECVPGAVRVLAPVRAPVN